VIVEDKNKMTFKGIPFVYSLYDKFKGADLNVFIKDVKEDSQGFDLTGIVKFVAGDGKGIIGSNKGMDVTGLVKIVAGNNQGVDLTGVTKVVKGANEGLSLTGGFNYFRETNDWSVSYATFGNVIKEVGPDAFYLQLGLFNRAGDHYSPLINIGGVKNLLKRLKK